MVITIPARLPSWNTLYAGVHHTQRTAMKNKWHLLVREALTGEETLYERPVTVRVDAYYKGNKPDPDNVCAKLIIDGLKGFVIKDDTSEYIASVTTTSTKYHQDGVVVTIEEI